MNYLTKIIIVLAATTFSIIAKSQTTSQKKQFVIQKSATINVADINEDWSPALQNIEAPKPGVDNINRLYKIKDSLQKVYPKKTLSLNTRENRGTLPTPYLGKNFQGNGYNYSVPNDNEIAISDSNKLISVMNTSVFSYDVNTNSLLSFVSLNAFGSSLNNPNDKYDPKVIYDPKSDKFILVYLNGFTDTTSSITVGFSNSNNPVGTWHLYELPGNPLNNGLWTDYPMIAMTDKEVFITANLLYPDSSWQTGFNETVIWQIDKAKGYNGQTLSTQMHHNIVSNGKRVRNLCPVKGGSTTYGPDIYFLSNRNLDPQNDSIFLVHITDTIGSPTQNVTAMPLISNRKYFVPPPAAQPGPGIQLLETNDARILGAYIENNKIQFVGNCMDTASGNAAIYHGVINNITTTPVVTANIITDTIEFGYPNISFIGKKGNNSDNRACISFNHSSKTVVPGVSAMIANDAGDYSPIIMVKPGVHYINLMSGNERWGDYTGSQRKYNDTTGVVWVNGMYGVNTSVINKTIRTWVGEVKLVSSVGIDEFSNSQKNINDLSLFPNPTTNLITVAFTIEQTEYLKFEIYDITGKLIKLLLREKVKAGKNDFSFSAAPLANGTYLLKVSSENSEFLTKKFIKQ